MRIEATSGPVTLVYEGKRHPMGGDMLKVAAIVAGRHLGTQEISYEDWAAFCSTSREMRSWPQGHTAPVQRPFTVYRTAEVTVIGHAPAAAVVTIDVPLDFFEEDPKKLAKLSDLKIKRLAARYVENLASDNGITINWGVELPVFVAVSEVKLV